MNTTSLSLLQRVRSLDSNEAWERFVELYTPLLFHLTRSAGFSRGEAADVVQDVFTVLVQKLPDFEYDPEKSFRAWLRTIALNKIRDQLRRRGRNRLYHADGQAEPIVADEVNSFAIHEYNAHLVQRALRIMQSEFQPTTWRACWEHVVNDRPAREVASSLGITANAVYLAKGRVLRRLREELDGLLD